MLGNTPARPMTANQPLSSLFMVRRHIKKQFEINPLDFSNVRLFCLLLVLWDTLKAVEQKEVL